MVEPEDVRGQRLDAKRRNEATKLSAILLNNLAVGIFVAGLIAPSVAGRSLSAIGMSLCYVSRSADISQAACCFRV